MRINIEFPKPPQPFQPALLSWFHVTDASFPPQLANRLILQTPSFHDVISSTLATRTGRISDGPGLVRQGSYKKRFEAPPNGTGKEKFAWQLAWLRAVKSCKCTQVHASRWINY